MTNGLLLLLSQLGFLSTLSTKTNSHATLVLEGCEDILETREKRLFFLLSIDHRPLSVPSKTVRLVFKEVAHADVVNLAVRLVDILNRLVNPRVPRSIPLDVGPYALTMECMLARIDKEFAIVEYCSEADIAGLGGIDHDVPVFLVASLRSKYLRILRVLFNLAPQLLNFLLIVVKTVAQVLLHVAHFGLLREQIE